MVMYYCYRCGYSVKNRAYFIKHLNRRNTCKPLNTHMSIEDIKKVYKICNIGLTPKNSEMTPKDSEMTPKNSEMTPKDSENNYECEYCKRVLSKNSHLYRHYKRCKKFKEMNKLAIMKKQNENLQIKVKILQNANTALQKKIYEASIIQKNIEILQKENKILQKKI